MSNKYRTATQTRRGARSGFPEHDDFEGLPVRQWRQEWVNVASTPPTESSQQNDIWDRELFYGMPKDAPLLAPHSQELLRAARSGRLYKRPAPTDDDDIDNDGLDAKGEKKESDPAVEGFMVRTWKQVPKNAEGTAVSHLAKRHKNTVTLPPKAVLAQITGPTATRHKVRRIDAAGNPYEQTVTVAEGQKVDGEIISTTIVPLHTTNPELTPQPQTTPARRRPPPPKRKAKGPGRGRKKGRLPLAAAPATPVQQPVVEGDAPAMKTETPASDEQAVKIEENEDSANQDSEMADNSAMPSEDEEGEDGEEEGGDDEGDETPEAENATAEQNQDQDQEMADSDITEVIRPSSIEEPEEPRMSNEEEEITVPKARFHPPTGLGSLGNLSSSRLEGSPLKNVILPSPVDQSPLVSPQAASGSFTAASGYMDMHTSISTGAGSSSFVASSVSVSETVPGAFATAPVIGQSDVMNFQTGVAVGGGNTDTAPLPTLSDAPSASQPPDFAIPPPAPAPEITQQTSNPVGTVITDTPDAISQQPENIAPAVGSLMNEPSSTTPAGTTTPTAKEEKGDTPMLSSEVPFKPDPEPDAADPEVASEPRPEPPDSPALHPTATGADEDEGLNLLGSLERELDRQEGSLSRSGSDASASGTTALASKGDEGNTAPAQVLLPLSGSGVGTATVTGAAGVDATTPVVSGAGDGDSLMRDVPTPVPEPGTVVGETDASVGGGAVVKQEGEDDQEKPQ